MEPTKFGFLNIYVAMFNMFLGNKQTPSSLARMSSLCASFPALH